MSWIPEKQGGRIYDNQFQLDSSSLENKQSQDVSNLVQSKVYKYYKFIYHLDFEVH